MKLIDKYNRVHDYLRISLTDKCNYNCIYCNPTNNLNNLNNSDLLSFEEILRLIEFFASKFEFKKFRFTGGEPLVRKDIFEFLAEVGKLKTRYGFTTGITTNGSLLEGKSGLLKKVGIDNLNISLDSISKSGFNDITKNDHLSKILGVINESLDAGYSPLKINTVVIKEINDYEVIDFVDYFRDKDVNLRFIEFMPFGNNSWEKEGFVSYKEIKNIIDCKYSLQSLPNKSNSVSKDFQLEKFKAKISFITSVSDHFCGNCNRIRISSKGNFRVCLFEEGNHNINFKTLLKSNCTDDELVSLISSAIKTKWEKHVDPEELALLSQNNMMTIGG